MLATGEVRDEPINTWCYEALEALRAGDGPKAERLLRKSLAKVGDAPDLLNNLAKALELQGQHAVTRRMIEEIHVRWPDYFFGSLGIAAYAIVDKDYLRAEGILKELHRRRRFHTTEFVALCRTFLQLYIGKQEFEQATTWVEMWKQIDPDNPEIADYESSLNLITAFGKLKSWAGFGKQKPTA